MPQGDDVDRVLVRLLETTVKYQARPFTGFHNADVSRALEVEAGLLRNRIELRASEFLDARLHAYESGNFGREPERDEAAEIRRLAYVDAALSDMSETYKADPIEIRSELYRNQSLRHYSCPDGEDCPVCNERRQDATRHEPEGLLEVANQLSRDPLNSASRGNPDQLHSGMLNWLAQGSSADLVWDLAGVNGPNNGPDGSRTAHNPRTGLVVLDEFMGGYKACIKSSFTKAPTLDELESIMASRSVEKMTLNSGELVRWSVFTVGETPVIHGTQWNVITVRNLRSAISHRLDAADPALLAYDRYLSLLDLIWNEVSRLRENGPLQLGLHTRRTLRESGTFEIVNLADRIYG